MLGEVAWLLEANPTPLIPITRLYAGQRPFSLGNLNIIPLLNHKIQSIIADQTDANSTTKTDIHLFSLMDDTISTS